MDLFPLVMAGLSLTLFLMWMYLYRQWQSQLRSEKSHSQVMAQRASEWMSMYLELQSKYQELESKFQKLEQRYVNRHREITKLRSQSFELNYLIVKRTAELKKLQSLQQPQFESQQWQSGYPEVKHLSSTEELGR